MRSDFASPLAAELAAFLAFKRARGYRYVRAEFMLRSFDRFLSSRARRKRAWRLDDTILAWLASRPDRRKAISLAMELSVIREFWKYLHRRDHRMLGREPRWPRLPTVPRFLAYVLSRAQVQLLLHLIGKLERPRFRRSLYRALGLVLYCTGIRYGEALRLRMRDLDLRRRVLFVAESKGRSRWVPFHPSLAVELERYLRARYVFVGVSA
jgi:integrase/recombinase XerD